MRDHILPVMHRQFISMIESNTASAEIRNMTPEYPNQESLVLGHLPSYLSELPPSPPSHTIALFPIVSNATKSTLPNPDPQTLPSQGTQQTPSPALSRLQASARHQQWLCCNLKQADIWQPSRNEVEDLDEKLEIKENVRSVSPQDAATNTSGGESLNAEQKNGQQNKEQAPQSSEETAGPGPQSNNTRHASENDQVLEKGKDDDENNKDDNDDVETVLDNGEEEMGGVLHRCGGRTGEEYEGLKLEVAMNWRRSWERQHFIVPISCL